ncbi:hypothetical protein LWE15_003615 [Escherichia coli]|nr:hypothetical protein [Escherichia coli]KGB10115.1 hypothetical protein DR73_4460 [Enterobacteriaceae bacterium ATCC 29904]
MHTRNVNVRTAAPESTGRCDSGLTVAQFTEVFCWVMAATEGELQPAIFTPPEGSHEIYLLNEFCPDYISIWVLNGWPVAIGIPQDNFFRTLNPSRIN